MLDGILVFIAGLFLLFFGKRLFWLAAALIAFLFGWQFFGNLFGQDTLALILAVVLAIIFAWFAVRFVRLAAYVIGFLAGAFGLLFLGSLFGLGVIWYLLMLIGGVLGVILVSAALDWGLILITAWAGSSAVVFGLQQQDWFSISGTLETLIFFGLLILGVILQASRR
jgi:hypothetical protein